MKRRRGYGLKNRRDSSCVEAATCEVCEAVEATPGDFSCLEGFLVCERCATNSSKLKTMRKKADATSQKERESP
jgi:hypothetical protein